MTSLQLSPGLRMVLSRSKTAASTQFKRRPALLVGLGLVAHAA